MVTTVNTASYRAILHYILSIEQPWACGRSVHPGVLQKGFRLMPGAVSLLTFSFVELPRELANFWIFLKM